jgi:peroxisomal 2,4-dienoyl-CoA reductase
MNAPVDTTQIFKDNIFAGKVVLCSGGGSGICRGMTEAVVRHGAKAVIFSRRSESKLKQSSFVCIQNYILVRINWKRQQRK